MKSHASSLGRWGSVLLACCLCCNCRAYHAPVHSSPRSSTSMSRLLPRLTPRQVPSSSNNFTRNKRRRSVSLGISSVDVEVPKNDGDASIQRDSPTDSLLSWKDTWPLLLYTTICIVGALVISTYEDFDVTHTRPSPSTLRLPTIPNRAGGSPTASDPSSSWRNPFNFIGAATKGLGWGPSDRGVGSDGDGDFFEEWYGESATTLQFKPSYNEIMLQHRSERVPRWNALEDGDQYTAQSSTSGKAALGKPSSVKATNAVASKEQLQQAVLNLYASLDELDELKAMADDYMWDDMIERLRPSSTTLTADSSNKYPLATAMEYSMDVLRTAPGLDGELPDLVGFDWGSCAWRHCGAKADAQEAIAELHGSVGMLEPFECKFIIDIIERSIRDVLAVVPDDLKPHDNGVLVQAKPYEPYVSLAGNDEEGMGIDYEYAQALSELRVDLSAEDEP